MPRFKIGSVFRALCPACQKGKILKGVFKIRKSCAECGYNFYPEPGFYLGAMVVGFVMTAIVTIPPTIALKMMGVELDIVLIFPLCEFVIVGTFLIFYCRILWLHLEYQMSHRLNGK